MEYKRLGRSGLKVARVCLGTMTFGREADEATSHQMLDYYVDLGGNFIDTADGYSNGLSEQVIGNWLHQHGSRQGLVFATKVYATMGTGPMDGGLSRIHIHQAVEASLRRLQLDTIDLYQIHRWDFDSPPEETLETLNDIVRQGKVRYIGCSNLAAWQLSKYLNASDKHNWSRFVSIQPIYNALNRSIENELLPLCADEGLGVMTYNPLAGGMLTGKYERGKPLPSGVRLEAFSMYYERYYHGEALDIVEGFVQAAQERHISPAQLALAWVLAEDRITCPILGARSLDQLQDTLGGYESRLTADERAKIPAAAPRRWVGKDPVYDREG
jgi:aryl-alcohol dehydrogenase-like predicted oxidoreductase